MSKSVKQIISKAAPIAAGFIPGVGPLAAAGIGAASGALGGGGLKGALLGGLTGGVSSAVGGGALADTVLGRGISNITGGLKDTLLGRTLSGVGDFAKGALSTQGINPNAGSGALGGLSEYIKPVSTVLGGIKEYSTQKDIEEQLARAQGRAEEAMQPYSQTGLAAQQRLAGNLETGFDPSQLGTDEGYKFRLNQGQQALQRSLSAGGMGQSGAALKAAQEYGQGLASQEYNDAYSRWLQQNNQLANVAGTGYNAASGLGDIYANQGQIGADATAAKSNVVTKTLQQLLSGRGAVDEEEEKSRISM